MLRRWHGFSWTSFVPGLACGLLVGWAVPQVPYMNWVQMFAPLDQQPLMIRHDAKGDGRFGAPRSGNRRHRGVDIAAPLGSPVRAVRSGRVFASGKHRGLGRFLELEHAGDIHSLYGHLDAVMVDVGDRIRQGQVIGTVGKTGNARSALITPHLHLEILRDGRPIDPATVGLAVVEPADQTTVTQADGSE